VTADNRRSEGVTISVTLDLHGTRVGYMRVEAFYTRIHVI